MKKTKLTLILSILLITACSQETNLQATPSQTAQELISTLMLEQSQPQAGTFAYESFKELFAEEFVKNATKEKFTGFKNLIGSSTGAEYITCIPIKLENGVGVLIYIVPSPNDEKYEIYDIVNLQDEVTEYFFPE